jgi:hypothetical protein
MPAELDPNDHHPSVLHLLRPGEEIQHATSAGRALLAVTTHRIAIVEDGHTIMDIALDDIRRIQFDIEKTRPATLVIVPDRLADAPQVLMVMPDEYPAVVAALVTVGLALASQADDEGAA